MTHKIFLSLCFTFCAFTAFAAEKSYDTEADYQSIGSIPFTEMPLKDFMLQVAQSQSKPNVKFVSSDYETIKTKVPGLYYLSTNLAHKKNLSPDEFRMASYCPASQGFFLRKFEILGHTTDAFLTFFVADTKQAAGMDTTGSVSSLMFTNDKLSKSIAASYTTEYGKGRAYTQTQPGQCKGTPDTERIQQWINPTTYMVGAFIERTVHDASCKPRTDSNFLFTHHYNSQISTECEQLARKMLQK